MGHAVKVYCDKCGDEMVVYLGTGMHYPTREDVEEGGWCESVREAIRLHPDWQPYREHVAYRCPCGYFTDRMLMSAEGSDGKVSSVDNVCPSCGRRMRRISAGKLDRMFEAPAEMRPKCRKCGGPLDQCLYCLWD